MRETPAIFPVEGEFDPIELMDAVDLASDQDQATWITDPDGKRLAALVPVEVLEFYQEALLLRTPRGKHSEERRRAAEMAES